MYFDKPLHWTSFKLVKTLRNSISRALGIKKIKVGHAGTLDPLASGVMIMTGFAIGALAPLVLGMVKQAAGLSFGISMLAVVWLVCGVVMLLGAKYFYMRDYNKIRHE